jgi:hypothetical protein
MFLTLPTRQSVLQESDMKISKLVLLLSNCALTSSVNVGLNVDAATPQNPGVSLHIGVNSLDAAYVPVAVARPCAREGSGGCDSSADGVRLINGANLQANNETANDSALAQAQHDRELATARERDVQAQIDAVSTRLSAQTAQLANLRAQQAATSGQAGGSAPDVAQLGNQIQSVTDASTADQATLTNLQQELAKASTARAAASQLEQTLLAQRNHVRQDNKSDALSVFGSFDTNSTATGGVGSTTGNSGSGGVRLGRMFSTGVASQNLTQGIGYSVQANALTQCLAEARQSVESITDPTAKNQRLQELSNLCSASVSAVGNKSGN